jgi:hypothetical protein
MHQTLTLKRTTFILTVAALLLFSVPAFALEGETETEGHHKRGSNQVSVAETGESGDDDGTQSELRKRGASLLSEKRKQNTSQKRLEFCTSHKQGLEKKFSRIVANAEKHQTRIDGVLAKATAYQTENNLTAENYDNLLANAETAQTAVAEAIATLKEVTPTVDCNSTSIATDVGTFKAAAQETRDSLKAYKTAVKAVLKALRDAKHAANATGEDDGTADQGTGDAGTGETGGTQ